MFHLETPVVSSLFMFPRNTTRFTLWFLQFASWWGQGELVSQGPDARVLQWAEWWPRKIHLRLNPWSL